MINGMDLFSGYGGISVALAPWVRPVLYCEIERYPQSILLSRMADGDIPLAPVWDDITTLDGRPWRGTVDIIYGGFPCQDISCAGTGKGLAGKRSGLFFEIMRLADEIEPSFLFFENVPAIRTRGLDRVLQELASRGYDCRWRMLSAQEVGAPHIRNRWFLLAANPNGSAFRQQSLLPRLSEAASVSSSNGKTEPLADADDQGLPQAGAGGKKSQFPAFERFGGWASECGIRRVADGCAYRMDRFKALGNGVVPAQVREAFRNLMFGPRVKREEGP
jgi:DNA (cytosine-5)-methyltransferase 1